MPSLQPELQSEETSQLLEKLSGLTLDQLKTVAEFVTSAGGFENALAAMDAIEELEEAA